MGGFLESFVKIARLVGSRRGEDMNYLLFLPVAPTCAGNNICSTYSKHSTVCDISVKVFAMLFPPDFSSTSHAFQSNRVHGPPCEGSSLNLGCHKEF
jgi:hypothetical protein